jgi:hypothetical protein
MTLFRIEIILKNAIHFLEILLLFLDWEKYISKAIVRLTHEHHLLSLISKFDSSSSLPLNNFLCQNLHFLYIV